MKSFNKIRILKVDFYCGYFGILADNKRIKIYYYIVQ